MEYKGLIFSLILFIVACGGNTINEKRITAEYSRGYFTAPDNIVIEYPITKKDTIEEDFFGVKVKDPYRWLEEKLVEDKETEVKEWANDQNKLAREYLGGISYRDDIKERLTELYNHERKSGIVRKGGKFYYAKNDGKRNHAIVYKKDTKDSVEEVFIDPNTFSEDGTAFLSALSFSKDGKFVLYKISGSGSDFGTIYVKNAITGEVLIDEVKGGAHYKSVWYKDGFFYSSNNGPDTFSETNDIYQIYYHKLGTKQAEDELVYIDSEAPELGSSIFVTEDERILVAQIKSNGTNSFFYKKNNSSTSNFIKIIDDSFYRFKLIDNVGDKLLLYTNYQATDFQLIEVDLDCPDSENWRTVIPEKNGKKLNGVTACGGRLIAHYTKEITSILSVFEMDGTYVGDIEMPDIISKTAPVFLTKVLGDKDSVDGFFTASSLILPNTTFKVNLKTLKVSIWTEDKVDFNSTDYETKYTNYTSKDGTSIPISIVYKKGVKKDGNNPTLLYGYGGFGVSVLPDFILNRLPFLEKGGIYVVANIRGGREKGQEWHRAGKKLNKQNVFDDFIAAAEFLIAEKYTSPEKLAIEGSSNGGLLVGACMTQRPDLYQVAFPIAGVLDMMRYHKFTIGYSWASEYGRSDDSSQYKNLLSYSPLHNVKPLEYPATMVMAADDDDRVVPAHSFKFTAALQDQNIGKSPVIIRVDQKAGHGFGSPVAKVIEKEADKIAFLMFNLKMKW